jgi:hypothetical protein
MERFKFICSQLHSGYSLIVRNASSNRNEDNPYDKKYFIHLFKNEGIEGNGFSLYLKYTDDIDMALNVCETMLENEIKEYVRYERGEK